MRMLLLSVAMMLSAINVACSSDELRIYESFDHCADTKDTVPAWSLYPLQNGEVVTGNSVASVTAKYFGCKSRYWKDAQDKVHDSKPGSGFIGITHQAFEYSQELNIEMAERNVSRTSKNIDGQTIYSLINYGFVAVKVTAKINNIETLVVMDAQAERGCSNGEKASTLISSYRLERNQPFKPVSLVIPKPCTRHSTITSDNIVDAFPYEIILLVRAKTWDNHYYYTVKKILLSSDTNR